MKIRFVLLFVTAVITSAVSAQTDTLPAQPTLPLFDELAPQVVVHQSEDIRALLISRTLGNDRAFETVKNGYRIQVYSSNNLKMAAKESSDVAEKMREMDLGLEVYRTYSAPFWRVRLGNYRTQADANEVIEELISVIQKQYPELLDKGSVYVVHDEEVVLMQ